MLADAVPNISAFRDKWSRFAKEGLIERTNSSHRTAKLADPKQFRGPRKGVKMVIGIFSTLSSEDVQYRQVIRDTWMTQPWICKMDGLYKPPDPDCTFFATFVVGAEEAAAHGDQVSSLTNEADVIVLPLAENMNCGKSRGWFEFAANNYTSATHIAKMDMDAFVDTRMFRPLVRRFQTTCPYIYGGRPWHCPDIICPPAACGHPRGTVYEKYNNPDPTCWSYMQGGFYFMSRPLALAVSESSGWWDLQSRACNAEDVIAGKAVDTFRRVNDSCVSAMNLVGWHTVWHPDWFGYWENRFGVLPE